MGVVTHDICSKYLPLLTCGTHACLDNQAWFVMLTWHSNMYQVLFSPRKGLVLYLYLPRTGYVFFLYVLNINIIGHVNYFLRLVYRGMLSKSKTVILVGIILVDLGHQFLSGRLVVLDNTSKA